jgi:hypothetical protein
MSALAINAGTNIAMGGPAMIEGGAPYQSAPEIWRAAVAELKKLAAGR